ncbi:MAG: ABC transporter permease [Bradymonadia bacterium]
MKRFAGFAGAISRHLVSSFLLLLGASAIIYMTVRLAPGNAVDAITPMGTPDEIKVQLAADFGLDKPPLQGFIQWASHAVRGDLGDSLVVAMGSRVADEALPAYLVTLKLAGLSLFGCLVLCFLIALLSSNAHSRRPSFFEAPVYALTTTPSFIMAVFLIHGINSFVRLRVDPSLAATFDWYALGQPSDSVVPLLIGGAALIFSDGLFIDYLNSLRAELVRLKSAQFILSIKSRGASIWPHVFGNLCIPLVAGYAARLPLVLSSVVIVEKIFGIEGAGFLLIEAAKVRDLPMVVGVSLLFTVTIILATLLSNLLRVVVDPREVARSA